MGKLGFNDQSSKSESENAGRRKRTTWDNPLLCEKPQTERDGTPQDRSSRSWMVALVAFLIVSAVVISGYRAPRQGAGDSPCRDEPVGGATVIVVQPKRASPGQDIVLPANVQAFKDAPITRARTAT